MALIVTGQEWVSLSMVTLFSPRGYAVLRAFSMSQGLDRLREASVDLVVVDRDLRERPDDEPWAEVRARGHTTPVLALATSPWQRDEKLAAMRAGAWDTVALPTDSEELFLRVDAWVRAKLAGDQAREQGLLDTATGLYNAQGLLRRIAELGAGAVRHRRPLACVVLTADPTPVGGTTRASGHRLEAAEAVAHTLRLAGRASDTIGRLSATEFVVVAPDTDAEGVRGLAERLRHVMEQRMPGDDAQVRMGCYAVPDFRDASIAPTDMLIRAAEALRDANPGRDTIRVFGGASEN